MFLSAEELLVYTGEERDRWTKWFRENGEELLKMPILGDRETTIGALILHIFGPEFRYVRRLQGELSTDYRSRPCHHIDELFGFGIESRNLLRKYIQSAPPEEWERIVEFDIAGQRYKASARKVVLHVLIHEIRHWAQVARLVRERGFVPPGDHDLLNSLALT